MQREQSNAPETSGETAAGRQSAEPYHLHLAANTRGRDFFLGDPHGRLDSVLVALGEAGFEPQTDRVICVGDLVDRGPNSYELLKLTRQPWFFSVRGNHEAMLLGVKDHYSLVHWLMNGGTWYLELGGEAALEACDLAKNLPCAITLDTKDGQIVGICHAEWPGPDWTTIETVLTDKFLMGRMLWGRQILKENNGDCDKTAILTVHGHSPIDEPLKIGTALFIDTGCVFGGPITLMELQDAINWPAAAPDPKEF